MPHKCLGVPLPYHASIVWTIERLQDYHSETAFRVFSNYKAVESIGIAGYHNSNVRWWLKFLTAFGHTLEYRKSSANGNADFCPFCHSLPRNMIAVALAALPP